MTKKKEPPENVGEVLGHNQEPVEHDRHDKPTHVFWGKDGSHQIVHGDADGYAKEDLVKLPKGYSEETHVADPKTKTFVLREQPLVPATDLHDRVLRLEQLVAQLTATTNQTT